MKGNKYDGALFGFDVWHHRIAAAQQPPLLQKRGKITAPMSASACA